MKKYIPYAFPSEGNENTFTQEGLTKREYYAALAMQALLSQEFYSVRKTAPYDAVEYADELIKALEETE